MRRAEFLFWISGAILFLACLWAGAAGTTTVGAAILFLAGIAALIWALFDGGHKLAGYVVLCVFWALGILGMLNGQRASSVAVKHARDKSSSAEAPDTLPADFFDKGKKELIPVSSPCENGLPAGARIEPFTAEDIARFRLIGARLSVPPADLQVRFFNSQSGKCLTKVEFEIVLAPGNRTVKVTESGLSLGPGYGYGDWPGLDVQLPGTDHTQIELISWKVTKAWGYRLP